MIHRFVVRVERKAGLSDPEGATTARALTDLGFTGVENVTFGRTITIDIEAQDLDEAARAVEDMCAKLLANPVIERYTVETTT